MFDDATVNPIYRPPLRTRRVDLGGSSLSASPASSDRLDRGAINYLVVPHSPPGLERFAVWTLAASLSSVMFSILLAVISLAAFIRYGGLRSRLGFSVVLLILFSFVSRLVTTSTSLFDLHAALDQLALLGVIVALASLRPRMDDLRVLGFLGVLVAGYSIVFGLLKPANAVVPAAVGATSGTTKP